MRFWKKAFESTDAHTQSLFHVVKHTHGGACVGAWALSPVRERVD